MKKLHLLYIGLLFTGTIYGQDISDAVNYSQSEIQGTARFRALSGAFGALGGDMSAVNVNPAGSAVFNQSKITFTGANVNVKNNTNYFNTKVNSSTSNFDINQGGAVFMFANNNNASPWRKFTFGIAYDRANNYNNNWRATGIGNTSIDRYFLDITETTNVPFEVIKLRPNELLEDAYADIGTIDGVGFDYQQIFLGFWGGIIDPVNTDPDTNNDNINYVSILQDAPLRQTYDYAATGYNGKIAFNFATQYKDNLYLGVNLNSHFINYQRSTIFNENDDVSFGNNLLTTGNGFSFQLGGIMKLTSEFRVGVTYDSPIWYSIDEETTQSISSLEADEDIGFISDITNVFPRYRLKTPSKITGSLAYVFGQKGLLSFDYSQKNYGNIELRPELDFFDFNLAAGDILANAATYRLGGEYKHKQFSFRGGYRFEESPYNDGVTIGDLTGYSLGLGYNFGNTRFDITYDTWKRKDATPLFNIGLIDAATISRTNSNITLSLSFNI